MNPATGEGETQRETEERTKELWKKFFVRLAGETKGTHKKFVKKLKSCGHSEVTSHQDCDYCLVFCPVESRLESDISSALGNSPGGKPTLLVVMYYTPDPQYVFNDSHRSVENTENVFLTVDCLFYKDELLKGKTNKKAFSKIRNCLGLKQRKHLKHLNKNNCFRKQE